MLDLRKILLFVICVIFCLRIFAQCTAVTISTQPQSVTANSGGAATFSVAANGTGPFTYFWYKDGVQIAGASSATYTRTNLTNADAGSYQCWVINCNNTYEAKSNFATLTVNANCTAVTISTQPQSVTANSGGTATFSVAVNGTGPFTYFWYKDGVQIAGASSATYTRTNLTNADAGSYQCWVINCNNTYEAKSNFATLTVNANCTAVTISTQPQSVTANSGGTATFSVAVNGTGPFTYFWYKDGVQIAGASSATYTRTNLTNADAGSYQCWVINCNNTYEAKSNFATLTVNANCTAVTIFSQPHDTIANPGGTATFSVTVNGTGPFTYFWYKDGVQIAGASSSTYTRTNLTNADAGSYQCWVINCNNTYEAKSNTVTLTISTSNGFCIPVTISSQPQSITANSGGSATFSVTPSGTGPFSYFWYKDGVQIVGASSSTYTRLNLTTTDAGNYSCWVTNCNYTYEAKSNPATLAINGTCIPVSISVQPQNLTANLGNTITFSVAVNGTGPYKYFWYKDGVQIVGAISSTYSKLNIINTDAGYYYCIVTNCNNTYQAISNSAKVTLGNTSNTAYVSQQNGIKNTGQQLTAAEPIQLGTGSYAYNHSDLKLPIVNDSLNFTRFYNSLNNSINGPLGFGWSHSYNYNLNVIRDPLTNFDILWTVQYPDGHLASFIPLNNGTAGAPIYVGTQDSLQKNQDGGFTMFTKSNHKLHFTSSGVLDQISDLNGNLTLLNYSGNNLVNIVGGTRTLNLYYNGRNITSISDPLNRTCNYNYDNSGNLQSAQDANGNITSFSYDNNHRMLSATNALSSIIVNNIYDATGRVINQQDAYNQSTKIDYDMPSLGDATVTNPDNSRLIVHHDSAFRKTFVKDELDFTKTYTYDIYSNENSFTDENGVLETRQFDKLGNLLMRMQPGGIITQISYNAFNSPIRVVDPNGNVTTLNYDANNNLISKNFSDNTTQYFTYYPNGLKNTFKDGKGNITTYIYSVNGDLLSSTASNGTKSYTYDAAGRRVSITDENGNMAKITYDNNDNITSTIDALNHNILFVYDANNQLISMTDKNGSITNFTYDKKGRMITKTNGNGGIKKNVYDVRDNLITVTDANNNIINYSYDKKGQKIGITNALGTTQYQYDGIGNLLTLTDGTNITTTYTYTQTYKTKTLKDGLNNTTTYNYDKNNNLVTTTDPLNKTTTYGYDALNRLISVLDAANNTTKITYDENGNKKSVSDPNGHTQTYTYDASNRLISFLDAEGNTFGYSYDPVGNNTTITKPTGTITKTYDVINRLISVNNSTGNNYGFTYDNNDNVITSSTGIGKSYFIYDKLNELTQYTDPFNNNILFSYDAVGNKQTITYPGNKSVSYVYDNANNLKKVTDWLNHMFSYTYDAAGRNTQLLYPNSILCNYTFDGAGRLSSIKTGIAGNALITGSVYTLDAVGNRIAEQKFGATPSNLIPASKLYTYGNDDRLLKDSIWTYVNDNAGNRTSETKGNVKANYTFSVDNRLSSIVDTLGVTSTFVYDAQGHRLSRSVGSNVNKYVLDISNSLSQILQITDATGIIRSQYVYGAGLLERVDSLGNVLYYHYDGQHNTVALTDANAVVTDSYTYDPFGSLLTHTGKVNQLFTFLGEFGVEQQNSSLYYTHARYYDSANGRFLSEDPYTYSLLDPQTINRYIYSTNNPILKYDYTGLYQNQDSNGINFNSGFSYNYQSATNEKLINLGSVNNVIEISDSELGLLAKLAPKLDKSSNIFSAFSVLEGTGSNIYKYIHGTLTSADNINLGISSVALGNTALSLAIAGGTVVASPVVVGGVVIAATGFTVYGIAHIIFGPQIDNFWNSHF